MNTLQRAIVRALNGTAQIGCRCWRWPWEAQEGRARIGRGAMLLFGAWAVYRIGGQWPRVGAGMVALTLIAGFRAGSAPEPEPQDQPDEDQWADERAAEPEQPRRPATAQERRQILVASVFKLADGRQGVHTERLLAWWQAQGLAQTLPEFTAELRALDIPVRASLKVAGVNRSGIHLEDLVQPAPAAPPAPAAGTTPPLVPEDLLQDW